MTAYQIGYFIGTLITPLLFMLMAGTVYYGLKRGSISFRQAILNKWVITSSVVLFMLSLVGRTSTYIQQASSHTYPEHEVRDFIAGCVNSASAHLEYAAAQNFCSCSIAELQNAYTYAEFKELTKEMHTTQAIPSGVREIMTLCAQPPS